MAFDVETVLTGDAPPDSFITSARTIIRSPHSVLVVKNDVDEHILPGGRREPGESAIQAVRREVREETGLSIVIGSQVAVLVFEHRSAQPIDYPYPYPVFLQVVYASFVNDEHPITISVDDWERAGRWLVFDDVQRTRVPASQRLLLDVVLEPGVDASGR